MHLVCTLLTFFFLNICLRSEGKEYTPKVFSALKTQAAQQAKRGLVYTEKLVFKGKEGKMHIHQRASKVFVGDPFAQYWCIDFGLLSDSLSRSLSIYIYIYPQSRKCVILARASVPYREGEKWEFFDPETTFSRFWGFCRCRGRTLSQCYSL